MPLLKNMSYRVFISYSHHDVEAAQRVVRILEENGLTVLWDQNFAVGQGFHEQIKTFITFSHVFLPVITVQSAQRGWVHQEIGYAMALQIPVLPVAVDGLPGQMLEQLHAVRWSQDDARMRADLSLPVFERLVLGSSEPAMALFQCATEQEERSVLIARSARDVQSLGLFGRVRHRGGLSIFDAPENPTTNVLWKERYGRMPRSPYQNQLIREERLALGEHARAVGCSLILNLSGSFDQYGPATRPSRLRVLRSFLASMSDQNTRVAIQNDIPHGDNTLMVGDWFVASAAAGAQGRGYRQTIVSRHAPTMRRRVAHFDEELNDLLCDAGVAPDDSRRAAIDAIDSILAELATGSELRIEN